MGPKRFFSNVICTQNCPRDQYPQVLFYRVRHRRQEFRVLDDFYKNVIFSRLLMSNSTLEKIPFVKIQMVWDFYFTFWFFLSTLFSEQNSLDIFPVFHYTNKNISVYMQLHIYIFL